MAAFVDYEFYTGTYLGAAIAESDFPRLAMRASEAVDCHTFFQAAPIVAAGLDTETIGAIKMATCAVAEVIQTGDPIQSEKVGQHSVTYAIGRIPTESARVRAAMARHLSDTGLMYGGPEL